MVMVVYEKGLIHASKGHALDQYENKYGSCLLEWAQSNNDPFCLSASLLCNDNLP